MLLTFLASLTIAGALIFIMRTYDLTLLEAINKSAQKLSLVSENKQLLFYSVKYEHEQVERPKLAPYPRIFFKELHYWDGKTQSSFYQNRIDKIKEQQLGYKINCQSDALTALINCYLYEPTAYNFARLEEQLKNFNFKIPQEVGSYGNGWLFAVIYDIAKSSSFLTPSNKYALDNKAMTMLEAYLNKLDGDSASLFHGRSTLAANAFLLASVIDEDSREFNTLYSRAHGHFNDFYQALNAVEIWPEGYNYWINERALQTILALSAFKNMQTNEQQQQAINNTIKRIGLWHIYLTRPDFMIEGWGDEGPRVDLKDETLKVIDLIAQITQENVFTKFGQIIRHKYKRESYYSEYRWLLPLLWNGKLILKDKDINNDNLMSALNIDLPTSELFGKNSINQLSMRNNWNNDATFVTYRAGNTYTHHQHYDAGHFSIFKGGALAQNASVYAGGVQAENRKYFSIRSIAKNSLLIQKPNERVIPNTLFEQNVADGGQRIVIPTGSAIRSYEDWQNNLYQDKHYEGAKLLGYQYMPGKYTAITSDLTSAYNSVRYDDNGDGKVKLVERTLVYLPSTDLILVYDLIITTNPSFKTKWLLHTANLPQFDNVKLIKGKEFDGILSTESNYAMINNLNSEMSLNILSPQKSQTHIVGGPTFKYYVEVDGDDTLLDGKSFPSSGDNFVGPPSPNWRVEISPQQQTINTRYLVALQPRLLSETRKLVTPTPLTGKNVKAALLDSLLLLWDGDNLNNWAVKTPQNVTNIAIFSDKPNVIHLQKASSEESIKLETGFNYFPASYLKNSTIIIKP